MATPARTASREAAEARRARRAAVTDPDVVMAAAAGLLATRSRTVAETRRRMVHLGYPPALCDQVVERLVELGYLDDEAFARAWVESRDRARPRGELALRRELQRKGVTDETIHLVLDQRGARVPVVDEDGEAPASADHEAALRLLARRASALRREPDPRRRRQKAYALLARNGFSPDVCGEAAESVADDPSEPEDAGV